MPKIRVSATMLSEFKVPKSEPMFLEQKLHDLENDNKTLKLKLDETVCGAGEANLNNSKLENQLRMIKTEVTRDKIDNLEGEIKSVMSKFEKTRNDLKELKTENEALRKNSTKLKSAGKDVKDVEKVKDIEIKELQNELSGTLKKVSTTTTTNF